MTAGPGDGPPSYVRFEAAVPNGFGRHPGVFALLRGLRESGRLSPPDAAAAAALVERSYALHHEPDAAVFDTEPRALSWFVEGERSTAVLGLAADVVALLAAYDVRTREVRTHDPGRLTYADDVQVVAVPSEGAR